MILNMFIISDIIINDKYRMLMPIPKFKEISDVWATYKRDEETNL